ncbi:hypothetical protein HOA64_03960 [bacterium]|nr:hypothetical protein [bacterium]
MEVKNSESKTACGFYDEYGMYYPSDKKLPDNFFDVPIDDAKKLVDDVLQF